MNFKNIKYLFFLLMTVFVLSSCSETNEDESNSEFRNWQERNDKAFADTLAKARQQIANGSKEWKVIRSWTLQNQTSTMEGQGAATTPTYNDDDYIVVHVLKEGNSDANLLYTDSIQLSYRGRLIPSDSYANGYVFDQTFVADAYSSETAKPIKTTVNNGWIDGFTTALLGMYEGDHWKVFGMHVGDHWQVFIPANLAYGSSANSTIPAYSMLRFEMALTAYKRGKGSWITEE